MMEVILIFNVASTATWFLTKFAQGKAGQIIIIIYPGVATV